MHSQRSAFALFVSVLAVVFVTTGAQVHASPATSSDVLVRHQQRADVAIALMPRDGHSHHDSHSAPLLQLNESEVLMHHAPTPPSYWTIDIDDHDPGVSRHPGLMIIHGLLMSLAFFVALPMGKCEASS
jgi:hypothetical protein